MKPLAIAALCAGLAAAPLAAKAEIVLVDAAGRPVAVLVPQAMPTAMQMFAQQDAMMDRMMQQMQRMDAAFAAGGMPMAPAGFGAGQPGSTVITTSFSDGRTSCSRTVVYDQRGGGAPVVQVRQTGDACGAMPPAGGSVPAALPQREAPLPVMRPGNPHRPELIEAEYQHPAVKTQPRRG